MARGADLVVGRRGFLIGSAMAATTAAAAWFEPRATISYLGRAKLDAIVPKAIGDWTFLSSSGLVLPPQDQLRDSIYSDMLTRVYTRPDGEAIMLLIAYSGHQDGVLQVHRPEVCYPASGYTLHSNVEHQLDLAGKTIDARYIVAENDLRRERLVYWTRLGQFFPARWLDQKLDVARENLAGIIPDGVLVRVSTTESGYTTEIIDEFIGAMFHAGSLQLQRVLVGQ